MYYLDSQRTKTRRDSSLVIPRKLFESASEHRHLTTFEADHGLEHGPPSILDQRPPGSVRKEIVTSMFEAMLDSMITSWNVVSRKKDATPSYLQQNDSELGIKKKKHVGTSSLRKISLHTDQTHANQDPTRIVWWSAPDETAVIHFRNGNKYEGNISKKVMHGEGRYQWADGTIYVIKKGQGRIMASQENILNELWHYHKCVSRSYNIEGYGTASSYTDFRYAFGGQFENNKISGRGRIQWKNDSWYEGEFIDNMRHGKGVFVESRGQRSYSGDWHMGTKHGKGLIRYSMDAHDSYEGDWLHNVRHGFGYREYTKSSGYGGQWETSIRDGKGLMIWPSGDFYSGDWMNGTMSGFGVYMWDTHWNGSLSMAPVNGYYGNWLNGKRHGCGILKLGPASGDYYQGGFNNNLKHGDGELVNNSGHIFTDEHLFQNDNFKHDVSLLDNADDMNFEMFSETLNLDYHVEKAIEKLSESNKRSLVIDKYLKNNKSNNRTKLSDTADAETISKHKKYINNFVNFEILQLRRAIHNHTTLLKNIYETYSTICNGEAVHFDPVLVRMYLWQFLYDCNVQEKGFTLVEIDRMFHSNPEWLSKQPHKPFEVINYWQFLHILIALSCKMYAKWEFPGPRPDTVLAKAFDTFMNDDAKMACGRRKGYLTTEFVSKIPLKGLYCVYRRLGEPHTVQDFLRAVRRAAHLIDVTPPELVDTDVERLPKGKNMFIIADKIIFIKDFSPFKPCNDCSQDNLNAPDARVDNLNLFNFGNLSTQTILKKFSGVVPSVWHEGKNINTDVEITFFEFFQVFIACAEESVYVTEEEIALRNKLLPKIH